MNARTTNLLAALAVALTDDLRAAVEGVVDRGGSAPAAIVSIGWTPGESIEAVSRTLGLTHSAAVRLIDRLVADGLVERRRGADGRSTAVHLTAAGKRLRAEALAARHAVAAAALESLTIGEQATLRGLIEKLLAAMTRDRIHADHICRLCDEAACPPQRCPVERAVQ